MKIWIDIDDTICNFVETFLQEFNINIKYIDNWLIMDKLGIKFEEFVNIIKQKKIYEKVELTEDAMEFIAYCEKQGIELIYITSRIKYDTMKEDTRRWFDKYKIKWEIVYTDEKCKWQICLEEKVDLFIDDCIENLYKVNKQNPGVSLYLINKPRNWKRELLRLEKKGIDLSFMEKVNRISSLWNILV